MGLSGEISLETHSLELRFRLSDPQSLVQDSLQAGMFSGTELQRADGLWQTTCLEAFWALPGEKAYWELNLSPSGKKWALYRFTDYRQPSPPAPSADFTVERLAITADTLYCKLTGKKELVEIDASLCGVVRTAKATYYYSTRHAGAKPDFHLRNSFSLRCERIVAP
ncbi:MAG TPA: hypothetical protein VIH99_03240 [Bdellovibrionota bacterium]